MMDTITPIQSAGLKSIPQGGLVASRGAGRTDLFADVFEEQLRQAREIRFSAHAQRRLDDRGITLSPGDRERVAEAVDKAAAKGCRESLVIMDRLALVVSVPNRTVITVVPQDESGDTVFTNIDSAVVVAEKPAA